MYTWFSHLLQKLRIEAEYIIRQSAGLDVSKAIDN